MNTPTSHAEFGLLPLRDLLTSDVVNEVVVNPDGSIWVEYSSREHMERVEVSLAENQVRAIGSHLAGETKNALGKDHPIVSGRVFVFGQSVRVQVIGPPAVEQGISLSIRKYINRVIDVSEITFLDGAQVDVAQERREKLQKIDQLAQAGQLETLFQVAIDERLNILISGGTSSGKTTTARGLLGITDLQERVVTIEDAAELMPPHENQVPLIADRVKGSIRSPASLLESSLRMRPDRLILGEIRGVEALNFLEAINTGHPGSISTIHADTPALALERMALMAMQSGLQLTMQDVVAYASQTINVIVQVGRKGGKRGVMEIYLPALQGYDVGSSQGSG